MKNKFCESKPIKISLPGGNTKKLLLHSCCAPCSCAIIETLKLSDIDFTIYYYNPNIYPKEEYEIRKNENKRYAMDNSIKFIDADYDVSSWQYFVAGLEKEPERGNRCTKCFFYRLNKTAEYAFNNNFPLFTSTLSISRMKNIYQIFECGKQAATLYPGVEFWDYNFRKNNRAQRGAIISRKEQFYRQNYCGCIYSIRK